MQIKDLIKTLEKCDSESEVYIRHHLTAYSPVEWVEHNNATKEVWLHHTQPSWAGICVFYVETRSDEGSNVCKIHDSF